MRYLLLALLLLAQIACGQGKGSTLTQPTVRDFVGTWEAFLEGAVPKKALGEEPSKMVVYLDNSNRIVVLLAIRSADRQIRFLYGIAKMDKGTLRFTDQKGMAQRISFGESIEHGRFLAAAPDFPDAESDYGEFLRVDIK